jgi:hypothetical protein
MNFGDPLRDMLHRPPAVSDGRVLPLLDRVPPAVASARSENAERFLGHAVQRAFWQDDARRATRSTRRYSELLL